MKTPLAVPQLEDLTDRITDSHDNPAAGAALIVLLDEIEKTALREPFAVEPITVLVKSRAYYRSQSTEKLQDALIKKLRADLAATTKSK